MIYSTVISFLLTAASFVAGFSLPWWGWFVFAFLLVFAFVLGTRYRKQTSFQGFPVVNLTDPARSTDHNRTHNSPSVRPVVHRCSNPQDNLLKILDYLDNNSPDSFVEDVYDIIKSSYTDSKLSVEDIAGRLNLTRVHVNRKLQAALGVSPSSLLKAYRMRLAASMILENEIPVAEIASRTGFSSGSYFSSAFKDFFGKSPSEYYSTNK